MVTTAKRRRYREDGQHLDEVGERGGVLERMRAIGIEEAAAIGAEHLDGFLRGHRIQRERLLEALRATASAMAMPTAAEVKLCQASPAIWVK